MSKIQRTRMVLAIDSIRVIIILEEVDSVNETALALRGFQHDYNRPIGARKALIGKNVVKWTCLPKSIEFAAETVCDP